jgi:hypothetical protein
MWNHHNRVASRIFNGFIQFTGEFSQYWSSLSLCQFIVSIRTRPFAIRGLSKLAVHVAVSRGTRNQESLSWRGPALYNSGSLGDIFTDIRTCRQQLFQLNALKSDCRINTNKIISFGVLYFLIRLSPTLVSLLGDYNSFRVQKRFTSSWNNHYTASRR